MPSAANLNWKSQLDEIKGCRPGEESFIYDSKSIIIKTGGESIFSDRFYGKGSYDHPDQ